MIAERFDREFLRRFDDYMPKLALGTIEHPVSALGRTHDQARAFAESKRFRCPRKPPGLRR